MPNATHAPHTVDSLLRLVQVRDAEVALLKLLVDKLKVQLLRQVRARFGASSEQLDDPQIALIADLPMHELAPVSQTPKAQAANSEGFDRSLPAHLPRENHVYRPEASDARRDAAGQACGCSACGGRLRQIGQDVSEQLEYVPSRFKVIRHVRPKLACMACESIFQAAAPSRPIARGVAGPGLLAHVLVAKYCDHQPLYRQSRIYAREGVVIERATMAGWVGQSEKLLDPLVAALGRYVLAGSKLHADDTPVAVLSPGRGKTKTGRLWVYVRDDRASASTDAPAAWLRYSPDRKGEHPQAHLKTFKGVLQADAYMRASPSSTPPATSLRPRVGLMHAGRSGICTRARGVCQARLRNKRSGASVRCMRSKPTSAGARRPNDAGSARHEPGRCSRNCSPGCEGCSPRCRPSQSSLAPSGTRSRGSGR